MKNSAKKSYILHVILPLFMLFAVAYFTDSHILFCASVYLLLITTVLTLLCLLERFFVKHLKRQRYLKSTIYQIDHMSGTEFENYLAAQFENMGYRVKTTPASNDYGADLILESKNERIAVQAKRYNGKVGNKAVQEIAGALRYYHADRGMVITNSFFTKNANELAAANGIELWDRHTIQKKFRTTQTLKKNSL